MTRITIPPAENAHTMNDNIHSKKSFANSIRRIGITLESLWKILKYPIQKTRNLLNKISNVKFIEKFLVSPHDYKKTIHYDKNYTSITLKNRIKKFIPNEGDKITGKVPTSTDFTFDSNLSNQFNQDFNRANYYFHTTYRQKNSIRIKDSRYITAKFGVKNAQLISQVAHQGFLADPIFFLHKMNKNESYAIGNKIVPEHLNDASTEDIRTNFIIEETKDGNCIVTANSNFEYINIHEEFGNVLPGLSISIKRRTFLTKSDKGTFQLKNNKDDFKITIKKNNMENIEQ